MNIVTDNISPETIDFVKLLADNKELQNIVASHLGLSVEEIDLISLSPEEQKQAESIIKQFLAENVNITYNILL